MHFKGAIVVSMRHNAWQGKIVECDQMAGDMPHESSHISLNMHATALVYISKDCHCHCEYIDLQTISLECIFGEP